jgi:hypothetical protein
MAVMTALSGRFGSALGAAVSIGLSSRGNSASNCRYACIARSGSGQRPAASSNCQNRSRHLSGSRIALSRISSGASSDTGSSAGSTSADGSVTSVGVGVGVAVPGSVWVAGSAVNPASWPGAGSAISCVKPEPPGRSASTPRGSGFPLAEPERSKFVQRRLGNSRLPHCP